MIGSAFRFDDGVDLGGEVVNIVARWGNAERHEAVLPLMYLYRRFVADSGGAGEHRGGLGHEFAVTPVEGDHEKLDVVTMGRGIEVPHSTGVFGGYPGANVDYATYRNVDFGGDGPFPPTAESMPEPEHVRWGVDTLGDDDVFHVRLPGSGGYGDPLDRDPDPVVEDVAEGKITRRRPPPHRVQSARQRRRCERPE